MPENIFVRMVINNLNEMQAVFGLTNNDFLKAIKIADEVGWVQAKPSSIALAIVRIVRPSLKNKDIYRQGRTEYQTLKKYTDIVCSKTNRKNTFF